MQTRCVAQVQESKQGIGITMVKTKKIQIKIGDLHPQCIRNFYIITISGFTKKHLNKQNYATYSLPSMATSDDCFQKTI